MIRASSSSSLNTLGFGFPYCGSGVIVPTSTKPKPKLNSGLYTSAFLSKPAATPIGFSRILLNIDVSKTVLFLIFFFGKAFSLRVLIAKECATSGLNLKIKGLILLNII